MRNTQRNIQRNAHSNTQRNTHRNTCRNTQRNTEKFANEGTLKKEKCAKSSFLKVYFAKIEILMHKCTKVHPGYNLGIMVL